MTAPRPQGVRVIKRDGTTIPCELAYAGFEEGQHVWEVATELNIAQGDRLHIDVLPGRTTISLPTSDLR